MAPEISHLPSRPTHPFAAAVCLLGCFLYMVLSEALLNALGLHYTSNEGFLFQKLHPGAILVFASGIILSIDKRGPGHIFLGLRRDFYASTLLLLTTLFIFIYAVVRSGMHELAYLLDTLTVVPIIALVLAYAPLIYARNAARFFIAFAALDAVIGMGEYILHRRVYSFDPNWPVLHEVSFRASSLMGHPLSSAIFLPVALFTALSLDLSRSVKIALIALVLPALIAFGSYFALATTICGLGFLGAARIWRGVGAHRLSITRAFTMAILFLLAVVAIAAQIFGNADEHTAALAEYTYIISRQVQAFSVFSFMSLHDLVFGLSPPRITELAAKAGVMIPKDDIDNPWILNFLIMGGGFFILWLVTTVGFLRALTRRQSLALTLAVLAYFVIASTSNSFGRKDIVYPATIALVACSATDRRYR